MSSFVTAVLKSTIGLLVNIGRDKVAERLKEGDVTEQKFRSVIVREIDDIKSKLDGLSRKDLLASVSFFQEGIELLHEGFDKAMDESALAAAKKRFKDARREATRAFKNEALTTSDRILAMEYRVIATILESIDNPGVALASCRVCIKELNCLPAVQNSFNVEFRKGITARFNKGGRGKIIASVCHVNRVIFDVTQAVGKGEPFWMRTWPTVDTENGSIDPLRDERLVEVLRKQSMEHCFVAPWSFGQEGVEEHRLRNQYGMAMNSKGQFIITEIDNTKVKVLDKRGQFIDYFSLPVYNVVYFEVFDVAVDLNDNVYVLVKLHKRRDLGFEFVVYVFNNYGEVNHHFSLKLKGDKDCLTCPVMIVNSKCRVVIMGNRFIEPERYVLDMHDNDGQFVRSFGEGLLRWVTHLALASDDRVIVLDEGCYVHMFSEQGDHLSKFKLSTYRFSTRRIAFHHSSEHIVVADVEVDYVYLHIYTKDGELVANNQTHVKGIGRSQRGRMIVTAEGHVALLGVNTDRVFILC